MTFKYEYKGTICNSEKELTPIEIKKFHNHIDICKQILEKRMLQNKDAFIKLKNF